MEQVCLYMHDLVLIKYGEEAKDTKTYGNLYECTKECGKLTESKVKRSSTLDEAAKVTLLLNRDNLKDRISAEWIALSRNHYVEEKQHCMLCNAPINVLCYIKNKANGNELIVGNECIEKFPRMEIEAGYKTSYKRALRSRKQIQATNKFLGMDSEQKDLSKEMDDYFNTLPLILPDILNQNLMKARKEFNLFRKQFVSRPENNANKIEEYEELKQQWNMARERADKWITDFRRNPFVCRRQQILWLKEKNPSLIHQIALDGGFYTQETLKEMYDPKFIANHRNIFASHIKGNALNLLKLNGNSLMFSFIGPGYNRPVTLSVSLEIFMKEIGACCLVNKKYEYSEANIRELMLPQTQDNMWALIDRMEQPMREVGIQVKQDQETGSYYYLRLDENGIELYSKVEVSAFLYVAKDLIFSDDTAIKNRFKRIRDRKDRNKDWKESDKEIFGGFTEIMKNYDKKRRSYQ